MQQETLALQCSFPVEKYPHITLGHGGGGKLTQQLIEELFLPIFNNELLNQGHDGTTIPVHSDQWAITTDSYVVNPLFFPGGNIGTLSVTGTLNDLAMCGATPRYLSCGFIIGEGLPTTTLIQVVQSMQQVAHDNDIKIITGDTKVIETHSEPTLFINTTGMGTLNPSVTIGPHRIQAGDKIILSGDIGRHEMAVIAEREGLDFEHTLESDCASLVPLIKSLINRNIDIHCLRDITRGGLATICSELSQASQRSFKLYAADIAIPQAVHAGCEILGLDPYYMANEGRCLVIVPEHMCEIALDTLQEHPLGKYACCIGEVQTTSSPLGETIMVSSFGTERLLTPMLASQLPRIC